VVLSAFLIAGLLIGYQLVVTLLHPSWIGPVTDWLRAVLAWPELAVVIVVTYWLTHTRQADARSWWMLSAGLLSYTVARTLWTVANQVIFHHGVPFPSFPDLFFVLQYPFFFLAVVLMPAAPPWGARLKRVLDCLLWMGAASALSWYFFLAPRYMQSGISPLAKAVCLAYPIGDLFLLFGLVLALLRRTRAWAECLTLYILCSALVCLMLADSWMNGLLLVNPRHVYLTGQPPDLFWLAFYLLVPLAGLVRFRLALRAPPMHLSGHDVHPWQAPRQDFLGSLRFLAPFAAALLASAVILIHATLTSVSGGGRSLMAPCAVSFGLLVLVLARQELAFLEYGQVQREHQVAQANALALREANRRMDEFLSILSHELKTPLTSLRGNLQLMARRLQKMRADDAQRSDDLGRALAMVQAVSERLEHSFHRLGRLVDDLLDDARIHEGRLVLRPVPIDLRASVARAVEEQRFLAGARSIQIELPGDAHPVLVSADAARIEQVVTNYLTNALKYSREDCPVTVHLEVNGEVACVSVRDAGIGVPPSEQAYIWDRFHRAAGSTIQSGSDVGVGIGLHICKSIVQDHGGQVGVASEVGKGSTFWFALPLAGTESAPDPGTGAAPA
jgi:signal transduction histidine kinase